MDANTATFILTAFRILEGVIKTHKDPIVDENGDILAENFQELSEMKTGDDLFRDVFGEDRDLAISRIKNHLKGS